MDDLDLFEMDDLDLFEMGDLDLVCSNRRFVMTIFNLGIGL